jgi:hypothetical protein
MAWSNAKNEDSSTFSLNLSQIDVTFKYIIGSKFNNDLLHI